MVYKIIGSAMLCLSGFIISVTVNRFQKRRLEVIDGFISLIFYIKGQVDCYSIPIMEMLENGPQKVLSVCGYKRGEGLDVMVEESRLYLTDESYRLLYCFSSEFGSIYREEQMKRCDYYIEALTEERKNIADDIPKKSRIYSTLAICSSLCLAIMLW